MPPLIRPLHSTINDRVLRNYLSKNILNKMYTDAGSPDSLFMRSATMMCQCFEN